MQNPPPTATERTPFRCDYLRPIVLILEVFDSSIYSYMLDNTFYS